ncbi:MAG: hypothetical protein GKR90_09410 [Pseudomonadales bacterium]|nr:hypothetical protein [Pseudomonadales bacterium]
MPTSLLAVMADGIGDLTLMSDEWVDAAKSILEQEVEKYRTHLSPNDTFTLCEVAKNPPAYLKVGSQLSWWAKISGHEVEVGTGELGEEDCDFKASADHSILSNIARIQYTGNDPDLVADALARLQSLTRWQIHGAMPEHPALAAILRDLHDNVGARTMPRFVFMTPEWVTCARHILTNRAKLPKYASDFFDVEYTFSEEFTETPPYAFPNGEHGGFWVHCEQGSLTVGAGPLPDRLEPADMLTKGCYTPVVPVGRTVNAAMDQDAMSAQKQYSKLAFQPDPDTGLNPVEQSSPSGNATMPEVLARIFVPLHDELSKRTSGELPADYMTVKTEWAAPQSFDRSAHYDASWLRYDKVDIYGNPRG